MNNIFGRRINNAYTVLLICIIIDVNWLMIDVKYIIDMYISKQAIDEWIIRIIYKNIYAEV